MSDSAVLDSEGDLHPDMLGGPFDTLVRRVGFLLRNRTSGLAAARRGFSTNRAVVLPPMMRPETPADVASRVDLIKTYIDKSGVLRTNNPTCLTIFTHPEFAWNGYWKDVRTNEDPTAPRVRAFDASNPVSADIWHEIEVRMAALAKELPANCLINTTAAVDTGGVVADGPQKGLGIGENRGIAFMGGAAASEGLRYGKYFDSKIDGWVSDRMTVQPVGTPEPVVLSVADVTGRRGGPVTIGFAICRDYTEKVFPMKPDILIVPAAGGSAVVRPGAEATQVIIADAIHNRFYDGEPLADDTTGSYTPAEVAKHPFLAGAYLLMKDAGLMGDMARAAVEAVSGVSPAAAAQTMMALQKNAAQIVEVGEGVKAVITEERPIPIQVSDTQIATSTAKVDAGTANILDLAGTAADPAKENPTADPFFDDKGPGELDAAGPVAGKAVQVARFGALTGRLAGYLPAVSLAAPADPSQADPQHVVLDGGGLSALGDAEKARLKQAYDAGKSITVLHPANPDVIAATFSFLHGAAQPCPCADRIEIIDAWMIQRDRNGGFRQTTLAVPMWQVEAPAAASVPASVPALGGASAQNVGWERDESEAGNAHQAGQLMAALQDAEARSLTEDTKPAPAVRARLLGAAIEPIDFIKEVQNVSDVYTQANTLNGQESPSTYTITNIAIPVSCLDNENKLWDYYYLAHQLVFSCGDMPPCTMSYYAFSVWTEQNATPVVVVSSPQTTEGQTTTTSSTSLSVSGNIGFFGGTPTGGVSVGGSWSKSTSYSSPDVVTHNTSDSWHPSWTFGLSGDISHTTFQPYMQEVFRFERSPNEPSGNAPFKTLVRIAPQGNPDGFYVEHWFNAPVPPAPQ